MSAPEAEALASQLAAWLEAWPEGTAALPSPPRQAYHWPPERVSLDFRVPHDAWTGEERISAYGEVFPVETARWEGRVFGRLPGIWSEAVGRSEAEMLQALREGVEPYLRRQRAKAETLGLPGRSSRRIAESGGFDLLRLLFCSDRDVSICAGIEIETRASQGAFAPSLLIILRSERHPWRRSAQWAALDMLEDPAAFFPTPEGAREAVLAIKSLMWTAADDYARAIYKAGVVLGGHFSSPESGRALLDCLAAPSRIARRSAMHAVFHLNEWLPEMKNEILESLHRQAEIEPESALRDFARQMAKDIERDAPDHVTEPAFEGEAW